ncbi:MAG TPA: alkaline phosphatase family protein [Gemmatimonadaceae bacterium]|nr:alkaline phosphatase family protein [Gemmatimonadaceae bacterium]
MSIRSRILFSLAGVACGITPLGAQARPLPAQDKVPRFVVFITIDQFRADYLDRFKDQFTGGLARLLRGGAVFTNGFQDHATTETAPGHASTLSGRFPEHTGIVRNSAGVLDPQAPLVGTIPGATLAGASPYRFRGGTLIDWIRMKDWRSRALSVSRKDRAAILPLGRAHQSVYWYDPSSGKFTTSTYYADTLPAWLVKFNDRRLPASFAGKSWTPLLEVRSYPEPDSVPAENQGSNFMFPHVLAADTTQALAGITDMPWMDELTLQVASTGYRAMNLGAGDATDLLAVSLSTTDAVGHRYGMDSRELHDQVIRVDRMLGAFFDSLFAVRDSTRVVIALTGDHGVAPVPEVYAAQHHVPLQRLNFAPIAAKYQQALTQRGVDPNAFVFDDAMLLVDRAEFARAKVNADSTVNAFATEVKALPGVLRVDRPAALVKDTLKDTIARRWVHSLTPDMPVELVVTLKPYDVWGATPAGVHGSPNDYDAQVPVVFWGAPFKPGRYQTTVRVVDMAPTLAWVTATTPTEVLDGHVLWEALR